MSFIRLVHPTPCWLTRRIIRCLDQIWIPFNGNDHWPGQLVRRIVQPHVGSSDPEAWIPTKKTGSLIHHPTINPTCNSLASDNPIAKGIFSPWKTCSLSKATTQNPTWHFKVSDNPAALLCLSDLVYTDYPTSLKTSYFYFLTWSWFERRFFLLPSIFLSFFAGLELILSKCAWNLRPTLERSSY